MRLLEIDKGPWKVRRGEIDMPHTFTDRLSWMQREYGSYVCAGIDPDDSKLPRGRTGETWGRGNFKNRLFEIGKRYVDHVAKYSCIFKPNLAFWAAHGAEDVLAALISYAKSVWKMQVILDAKYGDIGNTARFYARTAFERFGADAVTINAYLGPDTLDPWLDYGPDKAIFILCHTSNSGAEEFQDLLVQGDREATALYLRVAEKVTARQASGQTQIGLVMGATFPEQLEPLQNYVPVETTPLLIPGVGKQEGDLEGTVQRAAKYLFAINSSGGLLHASQEANFAEVAAMEANKLRRNINEILVAA